MDKHESYQFTFSIILKLETLLPLEKKVMGKGTVAKEQDFYFPKIKTSSPLHSFSSSLKKK